ncbi:spore germination protein [Paenibacillus sp. GCM10012307]|uniref:Spore germination protein n=1 Tax=Paenibacillus roseus TaxID=2798579 RepID=A0A934MR58_9BACL|nr:spore germination protein [Paenibacillus roseus]MBJ6362019.1 spore germination protein [Paenibacillus roseus]
MINRILTMFADSKDLITKRMKNDDISIEVAYIDSLCDESKISEAIFVPFSRNFKPFEEIVEFSSEFKPIHEMTEWASSLLRGYVLIYINSKYYSYDASRNIRIENQNTQVESSIQGPQIALTEDLKDGLNLIRNRYPEPNLAVEERTLGVSSKTRIAILFDNRRVNDKVLKNVKKKILEINADMLHSAGEIVRELGGNRKQLFPTTLITERPDRISNSIAQGKVIILIHGSMFGIILPITFYDLMNTMDDQYESFWMSRTLMVMRYISVLMTVTLPAMYISIVSYNPELFRVQLAFSIAGSRSAVPYPSFIEVLVMLFMIEMLVEASVRLPRYIGSTGTTVGGLILGQAAQQAGLVSSIMIIVTSVVAISNFVIPNNSLAFAIRFLKYPLIFLAVFYGITGVCIGMFCYLVYLSSIRSFGVPYFRIHRKPARNAEGDLGQVSSS